jgi:hypothetical protein
MKILQEKNLLHRGKRRGFSASFDFETQTQVQSLNFFKKTQKKYRFSPVYPLALFLLSVK